MNTERQRRSWPRRESQPYIIKLLEYKEDVESNYLDKKEKRTDRVNENVNVKHSTNREANLKTIWIDFRNFVHDLVDKDVDIAVFVVSVNIKIGMEIHSKEGSLAVMGTKEQIITEDLIGENLETDRKIQVNDIEDLSHQDGVRENDKEDSIIIVPGIGNKQNDIAF